MDEFPFEILHQEHQRILEEAEKKQIVIRLLGALAFDVRCPNYFELRRALGRTLSDLDYMAISKQWEQIVELLTGLGYSFDERRAMLHGLDRVIFFHPNGLRVDIFFDKLDMCHEIDFRNRLTIDPQTISLSDLLLEKLQIVRINEKDIIDIIILLLEHPILESEEGINARYIVTRMASDWGFYYTAKTNLQLSRDTFLNKYDLLGENQRKIVHDKIDQILNRIEAEPKTMKWKLRAQIGSRAKWYKDVGELER
jgi:hypothetical protein